MNNDISQGKRASLHGQIRERWGKLTDDELDQIMGKHSQLIGKLQEKFGYTREEAERQLDDFLKETNVSR